MVWRNEAGMRNGEFEMGAIGEGFIEKMTFTQREGKEKTSHTRI